MKRGGGWTTLAMVVAAPWLVGAAPPVEVQTAWLQDGTELVFVRLPRASQASFRYVVRSGATSDPFRKEGLAHLLEHLIFHGSYCQPRYDLDRRVRAAGAYLNAFTGPSQTWYVLDAPQEDFLPLMGTFLQSITGPALTQAPLESEKGVVETEYWLDGGPDLFWAIDKFLFPSAGPSIIGSAGSRRGIARSDLVDFFSAHYVPKNTTIVVVADRKLADIQGALEEQSRLAPSLAAAPLREPQTPNLPSQNRARGPRTMSILGYRMPAEDRPSCAAMAQWLHLRVAQEWSGEVFVHCANLRGDDFIFAGMASRRLGATMTQLESAYRSLRERPLTEAEAQILRRRAERVRARTMQDPGMLADALVDAVRAPASGRRHRLQDVLTPVRFDGALLSEVAHRTLDPEGKFVLELSPF